MSLIGYARVSTTEQDLALQRDALHAAGTTRIFEDRGVSGARTERPGLNAALSFLRDGDTLVVWKLDRLGDVTLTEALIEPLMTGVGQAARFATCRHVPIASRR